jgi:GMP synthase-like glutamine amidotransferase
METSTSAFLYSLLIKKNTTFLFRSGTRISELRIHYFQHVPFEDLGIIRRWIDSHAHSLSVTQFFLNSTLPKIEEIDWLIVMGGSMGVNDEDKYPWLIKEKKFISEAILQNKRVLGICLGSQLIASALGANVYPNAQKEIGWFPVRVTPDGKSSSLFKIIPQQFNAFHWHGDTFDLPKGARWLAESEACKHQAFSIGENVLGLQFHLEIDAENIDLLIQNCGNELQESKYIQSANQLRIAEKNFAKLHSYMYKILDQMSLSK